MTKTCPSQDVLSAFVLGNLSESELDEVAAHLESCSECEEAVGRLDARADAVLEELRRLPDCVLRTDALATDAFPTADLADRIVPSETWGDFRIVREIGRGGMGIVCEAFQGSLRRHVALKFLPGRGDVARFRREARAAGRLHHTNIVPVFGVGEHQGCPYYVMQFIAGRGLDVLLQERKSAGGEFSDREVARVGVQVAEALAYAHAKGVIHRDIKPSNLLMDDKSSVWIADFGLAADASDSVSLTESGEFLGTLRYVAAERLNGRGDARADLYGLGVTLYELACGRPAFGESDRAALIHQILHQDPTRPRQLAPGIARDLETIILKAMARDPAHRYATADAMADDLRRFLDDRPILARRARPWERAARWSRRNPGLAIATGSLALALAATTSLALAYAGEQSQLAEQRSRAAHLEKQERTKSEILLSRVALQEGISLCQKDEVSHGLHWLARALTLAPPDDLDLQREIRLNLRRWSRSAPQLRSAHQFSKPVHALTISPDGSRALAGSDDGTARLWEPASDRTIAMIPHAGPVRAVAFSPDGSFSVTGSYGTQLRRWRSDTGEEIAPALKESGHIDNLEISPDGRFLATGGTNRWARLWDLATGRSIDLRPASDAPWQPGKNFNYRIRFSADGSRLVTLRLSWDENRNPTSQVWAVPSGQPIGPAMSHDSRFVWATASDPVGKRFLSTEDQKAWMWDTSTGKRQSGPFVHHDLIASAAFSRDGRWLAAGCGDGTITIWDPAVPDHRAGILVYTKRCKIVDLEFRGDGLQLLTTGDNGEAQLWDPATRRRLGGPCLHSSPLNCSALDAQGQWILTGGEDGVARVWKTPESVALLPVISHGIGWTHALAFSPDGSTLLTGNDAGELTLRDSRRGVAVHPPMTIPGSALAVAFSPDSRLFAVAGAKHPVQVFEHRTCRIVRKLPEPASPTGLAFRPRDGALLVGGEDGRARLWDVERGRQLGPDLVHGAAIRCVAISPDSGLAITAGDDRQAIIWDLDKSRRIGSLEHPSKILDLAFVATTGELMTGCGDGVARLWDLTSREPVHQFRLGAPVNAVATSPDGRTLAAGGVDRMFTLWDARTGQFIDRKSERQAGVVLDLAFRPDGKALAIGLCEGTTDYAEVAIPDDRGIAELTLWSQVLTNTRLDQAGKLVPLTYPEWTYARQALASVQARREPSIQVVEAR